METAGPSTRALDSTGETREEKHDAEGPPTLTRNRSFKSKQLVRSQAIRESQSPPRLPSPLPPNNQLELIAAPPHRQSNSETNQNVRGGAAEVKSVSSTTFLRVSGDSFNVTNNDSSKSNSSSLNENDSDRNASQSVRGELDPPEGGGGRNKQRGRRGDRSGEGKQRREGKECQQVEIQITSGNWELGSPARNRSPKNRGKDHQDRHCRTQAQRRWLSTKKSSQDFGWRSLEEESWRNGCVCGACGQDKECLWNQWGICPDCRGRKNRPPCPSKQDSGVVCSDDCSDFSDVTSPEIVLSSTNSEPILAADRRRGKDSDKYPENSYYTMCRCHERSDKLSNNNSINSNKNTPALLKHLIPDEMDNKNNELSGAALVQFVKDTLNKSIKDRISLLRIEKELVSFVHDTSRTQQKFPSMTSYGRMLVHRCAQLFCLQHKLEPMAKEAVIVTKVGTFGGRVPCTPFEKWCFVQFPDASAKSHQDMTQAKSILKRSAHSLDESVLAAARGSASARSKSFEQREEEYERVRRRIFSGDEARGSMDENFNWLQQSEENVCVAGNTGSAGNTGNTGNVYGKLLTPDAGGATAARHTRLLKVHSLETRTVDNSTSSGTSRAAVSKSHSFGGYGSSQTPQSARILSRQGDLASSSWRLSPSSSGYKTLSLRSTDSITPSPTGDPTPEPEPCVSPGAPLLWAMTVSDMSAVPLGAIIIHPKTGMPLTNADGSTYHYDPNQPPMLPTNTKTDKLQTQPPHTDAKNNFPGEKRRGRLEKQHSITGPDNQECSQDALPEYTNTEKCCLECCQPKNDSKAGVAIQSGHSNTNTLTNSIANEHNPTLDKEDCPNVYHQSTNELIYSSPSKQPPAPTDMKFTKAHSGYVPYGDNYQKILVYEGQTQEMVSQKINCENTVGCQNVSGIDEAELKCYRGPNIIELTNVIQQNQEPAMFCNEGLTHKIEPQHSHYRHDGATCQPLHIQLASAGAESYAAQVAEHCRLEQNVIQAYALTHQQHQLAPTQQPALALYAQPPPPLAALHAHDGHIDGRQSQPNLVYGAYATCGAHNCTMMDHTVGLAESGRGLLENNPHPTPPPPLHPPPPSHHPYPVYQDPALMAQRYGGLQMQRQAALLHHAYQYPPSWTTHWPLISSNTNIANQNCPKPQTPPTVYVPQPDLTLAYQTNPGLVQYPGLLQYPPVNYTPLVQPHLIHTQPYVCPSVYPQHYMDARTQIPANYTETQMYQTNPNNNSAARYEGFQSTNARNFSSNLRSSKCVSRTGSASGSSRTTPLGGQYTPPSNFGENLPQELSYPVYRGHSNPSAYCLNTNYSTSNQSQSDLQCNETKTYSSPNLKGDQNKLNERNVSSNGTRSDVHNRRRAFKSNASRSQNSLPRQDSFDGGNTNVVYVQEKISQIDIANDEHVSNDANHLNVNDSKPFISNLSPNSQNFVPKSYGMTSQTELNDISNQQTIYTKNRVYSMAAPANLVAERDMHSLRDVEDSMRSSEQNKVYARNIGSGATTNSGNICDADHSADNSNISQSQQPSNKHCNVDSCHLECETNLKTNPVQTNLKNGIDPNLNSNVRYQQYGVPPKFDNNYSDAVKKTCNDNVENKLTDEKDVNSESKKEYDTKKEDETQANSQLLKAISNINTNHESVIQNTNGTENNTLQTQSGDVITSPTAIYARPVDTSTAQDVSNVSNYQTERTNSIYNRNDTSYERSATSITALSYPGLNQNGGAERSFQQRNSGHHGFVRRDSGFRFRFSGGGVRTSLGLRAPTPGAVQQLHQQMQLQYGGPLMFARQMYTGGWSRRSPSPLSSTYQNGPRYSGPRPVRPAHFQDKYIARR